MLIDYRQQVLREKLQILDTTKQILGLDPKREELERSIRGRESEIKLLEKKQISVKGQMNEEWTEIKENSTEHAEWYITQKATKEGHKFLNQY